MSAVINQIKEPFCRLFIIKLAERFFIILVITTLF